MKTHRGFTLIEMMVVLAVTAVLTAVSYPSYAAHLRRAKRADAIARLSELQFAEEHWRANHDEYGSLSEIGIAAQEITSAYTLSLSGISRSGYVALAGVRGVQAADTACRYMQMTLSGNDITQASGPDEHVDNDAAANKRCWLQ